VKQRFSRFVRHSVAAVAALGVSGCETPASPGWTLPEGVKTLPVNGYPMAYSEVGRGPTVVLVHGIWSDYRAFGTVQRGLADRFRAVSVSLRHAYPQNWDGSDTTFSLAQHTADLAAFIEKLGAPVRLVGQSYGAQVAMEVARARPELVSKLVLAEGGSVTDRPGTADDTVATFSKLGARTGQLFRTRGIDAGLEFAVDLMAGAGAWSRYPQVVKDIHRQNAWTLVALARDAPPQPVSCAEFGRMKMPVLLMTGENTSPRHKALVRVQSTCLPTASTATIPGVGHVVQLNPSAVDAALKHFLP